MADQKTIFEKYFNMSEADVREETKTLTRNKIQRQFEVGYDSAVDQKIQAESSIAQLCGNNFENFNLNFYLEAESQLEDIADTMEYIEKKHVLFFGTDLRTKL